MLCPVYHPFDLTILSASGSEITTNRGVFLDTFAGIGVLPLGHSYPAVVEAVTEKMKRYAHISNYFSDPDGVEVARLLCQMAGREGDVYFANSGAEATEAALKAIRKYRKKGMLVSFIGNFHGRTCGALSVTWSPSIREPFEPLLPDVVFLPKDVRVFREYAASHDIAGVFLECVQGNSGVLPLPHSLVEAVAELKEDKKYYIVADEIQAGLGRTGCFFSFQHWGLEPDIITCGKGIGGGLPLGATIFCGWSPFQEGDHGSTFAPNPISLAAGKVVLQALTEEFLEEVKEKGAYFAKKLEKLSWSMDIRQLGLMIGVSTMNVQDVKQKALERKVLLNVAGGSIRLLPALNISYQTIDEIIDRLTF
ncbi:aspartate aminotransferase family protein [Aminobacterium mobile]|jgi:acetylornithine/N-succinyldiaminopimelate aminotransferase